MSHGFKTPGILRAAFAYQDLIGVEVLLRMFRDPSCYAWVKLEADDVQFRAIDDIVACRQDGALELLQVKFTPDPTQPAVSLSWNWLLARATPASRSLLEKWSTTAAALAAAGRLATAGLRTDRRPDAAFSACLAGDHVDYDRVPPMVRSQIEAQLGGEAEARAFFGQFAFWHSEDQLDDLEYRLKAQVVPSDTDEAGWLSLMQAIWVWSTLKDRPRPGGEVTRQDLVQYITRQASKPIPQDFRIPDGYEVPDREFHEDFIHAVADNDGVKVLWGPPGRGKSTYLSFCGEERRRKHEVWVRHHYFLSTTDTTTARFYFHEISQSLIAQIRAAVPEASIVSSDLRGWITAAGAHLGASGRRLVVVIDGLDHVWREGRSLEQMAQLFNTLLPLAPFVSLVVGTQKVPDEQLPARLLEVLPKDRWTELPLMSPEAVRSWLMAQRKAGRLELGGKAWETDKARFTAVATAFHEISRGLPLHLIYSFEALVRRGGAMSADDVKALPSCPDGDIRTYYRTLWSRIGPRAREVLHVLAGVQFAIPAASMWDIFGRSAEEAEAIEQIDHLLERRPVGLLPFHGSVFAFVRDLPNQDAVFRAHGPRILEWLDSESPPYWRWAWLWVTRAQLGDGEDLLRGPTREWAIAAMANGFGLEQIKTILEQAEEVAFAAMDLPRLFELRSLYTRAANAPEFQMRDMDGFIEVASALSGDDYPRLFLHDELTGLAPGLMLIALRSLKGAYQTAAAREVLKELDRRIQRQEPKEHQFSSPEDWRREMVRTAALAEATRIDRVVRYARQFDDADTLMTAYARECLHAGKSGAVIAAAKMFNGRDFSRELVAALCAEGLTAPAAGLPKVMGASPLLRTWCRLKGADFGVSPRTLDIAKILGPPDRYESHHNGTRTAVHQLFFTAFASALDVPAQRLKLRVPSEVSGAWLEGLFTDLAALAGAMGEAWTQDGVPPSMAAFFAGLDRERPFARSYGASREMVHARLGLFDIAIDLQILAAGLDPGDLVTAADIAAGAASPWWLDGLWLQGFVDRRFRLHAPDGAEAFTARIRGYLDATVTDFSERAEMAVHVSLFAYDNGLDAVARAELLRTADCALGYGWRKDGFAFEILTAIEHLLDAGSTTAAAMILEVAAAFDAITEYTDGDETNHARSKYYALLARVFPDRGVACYETQLAQEEWRYADELLQAFATTLPEDRGRTALLRTFIQSGEFEVVSKLLDEGRDDGVLTYLKHINGRSGSARKHAKPPGRDSGSGRRRRRRPIDVTAFPPDRLTALVTAVRSRGSANDDEGSTVDRWLAHWEAHGQGVAALEHLAGLVAQEHTMGMFDRTLDLAFEMSLRLQGRSRAFDWAVLAHRYRYGWHHYFTSQREALQRLDIVVREFPTRWRDFIDATSEPIWRTAGERSHRVMGTDRLVYFLAATGNLLTAESYVGSMIKVLLGEVSNQPLVVPKWAA